MFAGCAASSRSCSAGPMTSYGGATTTRDRRRSRLVAERAERANLGHGPRMEARPGRGHGASVTRRPGAASYDSPRDHAAAVRPDAARRQREIPAMARPGAEGRNVSRDPDGARGGPRPVDSRHARPGVRSARMIPLVCGPLRLAPRIVAIGVATLLLAGCGTISRTPPVPTPARLPGDRRRHRPARHQRDPRRLRGRRLRGFEPGQDGDRLRRRRARPADARARLRLHLPGPGHLRTPPDGRRSPAPARTSRTRRRTSPSRPRRSSSPARARGARS